MPSLFRRPNGYYYVISRVNGRRIWKSTGCRSKTEALEYVKSQERKPKEIPPIALSQFSTQILSSLKVDLAPGTVQLYRSSFALFQKIAGDYPLREYTPQMVEHFKSVRLAKVSPVKVNIDFRTLRAAFNIAINWGLITENPFKKCKQIRVPHRRPVYLTHEEFAQLMKVVPNEWFRDIIRFAVGTMMRLGEIVNLRWDSVNPDRRIILVENSTEFRTKTHKTRAIPMDELIHLMLLKKPRLSERVFTFPDGRPFSVGYVSSKFKEHVRKANLSVTSPRLWYQCKS